MSRLNKPLEAGQGSARGNGAEKLAFVERLQTILSRWPSADRLARVVGVPLSAFRKWLKGEAEPSRAEIAWSRWLMQQESGLPGSPRRRPRTDLPAGAGKPPPAGGSP